MLVLDTASCSSPSISSGSPLRSTGRGCGYHLAHRPSCRSKSCAHVAASLSSDGRGVVLFAWSVHLVVASLGRGDHLAGGVAAG